MPDVCVVPCKSYEQNEVRAALAAVLAPFGLDWVRPGMRIAVKVNLVGPHRPEKAATTHPAPVRALCELLTERGASVVVGDSPGGLFSAAYLAPIYGATRMADALAPGAKLNDDFTEAETPFPNGVAAQSYRLANFITGADAVIDFCKPKTHGMMAFTGACKNFYGAVPGLLKGEYHYRFADHERFANMLVDIAEAIKPRLCIADFVWGMEGNGPSEGTPRFVGALAASIDPHKLDLALAHIMGMEKEDVPTLMAAFKRGLIPASQNELSIEGDLESLVVPDYQHATARDVLGWAGNSKALNRLAMALLASRPRAEGGLCVGCGKCAEVCPAKAIRMRGGLPRIDRGACIRCFCCQEFCPKGAMKVHRPAAARLLNK